MIQQHDFFRFACTRWRHLGPHVAPIFYHLQTDPMGRRGPRNRPCGPSVWLCIWSSRRGLYGARDTVLASYGHTKSRRAHWVNGNLMDGPRKKLQLHNFSTSRIKILDFVFPDRPTQRESRMDQRFRPLRGCHVKRTRWAFRHIRAAFFGRIFG